MNCLRCGRPLKHPSPTGYGPVCAQAVLGVMPRRQRKAPKDERTVDMWAADLEAANRVETLLSGICLEMTA